MSDIIMSESYIRSYPDQGNHEVKRVNDVQRPLPTGGLVRQYRRGGLLPILTRFDTAITFTQA
jgi:hypothetical protein